MQIEAPARPQFVMSTDGLKLATYQWGEPDAAPVLLVHGFASGALLNWQAAGWVRDLVRAGLRVIAFDQRGHGSSDKPHDPALYSIPLLVGDVLAVLDAYLLDEASYVGYSLGARVGWQAALDLPERISRGVLGGIPMGDSLTTFDLASARESIAISAPVTDAITKTYLTMASGIPGNDLTALVALVEGLRGGILPGVDNPPQQPLLFATGGEDAILDESRTLATAAPRGEFVEIPGRAHFNAPTSKLFREAALGFLRR